MPHPCVVCGRSRMNPNNREEEYMFFSFPVNDEARCRQWLEFCGREDLYKLSKRQLLQRMVCSKHFEQNDFLTEYLDRLHSTAVPTIYDPLQSLYNITCIICKSSRRDPPAPDYDGTTFHHFPGEEFRCLKWLDFVGVESYYRLTRKEILFCYICSKHFDRSQFVPGYKGRLTENAVPTIRYPKPQDMSNLTNTDLTAETKLKLFAVPEKKKKNILPVEVLESQACAACGRSRSDPRNKLERYKFHPFPAYEIGRCLRWCQFLGREDLLSMSPNQIRKLVLCSRHFQTGQNFHKSPCDAIPTIKDVSKSLMSTVSVNVEKEYISEDSNEGTKRFSRPLVSSKKPKIENKPTPLAKKRGKSRRPTSINIPKPDGNMKNRIKKLPLPSSANWKIQLGEQLQPMAVNNIVSNVTTTNLQLNESKKVIMPITWDISNLGAPIPVHSLSSMPPGLLIKINLPEQKQQKEQKTTRKRRVTNKRASKKPTSPKKNGQTAVVSQKIKPSMNKNMKSLSMSSEATEEILNSENSQVQEDVAPQHQHQKMKEQYFEESTATDQKKRKIKRKRITGTMKRTTFPITCEVSRFLKKLTPLMHRFPKKARAHMKLSIVNMVIDHL
ncbi:uncharacterized protein LOC116849224 [Odontomachus brunneus]|uniref:uncharacterized protein LOC116849224 n=1 Tax=Odontomachus brunneus TaxID=486640 RepID=UPI0013F293AA|nr:uncharacterized protein LOC116849224 [Odontomachus brunneus]XP_032682063.1 uncharacterized protein LOC116849224 [Odontomachus brunneus]